MSSSSQMSPDAVPRSKLAKTGAALVVGVLVGFLGLTRGCGSTAQAGGISQERYAVVIANLLAEGETLRVVNDYLPALGISDPHGYLLRLSGRYSKSTDRQRQRWAEDLRQLAEALEKGIPVEEQRATPQPAPTVTQQQPSAPAQASPVPSSASGVVKTQGEGGVRLRAEPNTTSPALALLANGARVEILNVVDGQAVAGSEKRWYKVRNGQQTGYIYFQYLAPAD